MKEWLKTLTEKQLRALACQCDFAGWNSIKQGVDATIGVGRLIEDLLINEKAKAIYQETYGKETSIQE